MFLKSKIILLKVFLISLYAINILSLKQKSQQTPQIITSPSGNGNITNNLTNITQPTVNISTPTNETKTIPIVKNNTFANDTGIPQFNLTNITSSYERQRKEYSTLPSGEVLPSTTVVNTNEPIITLTGEAKGILLYDLIKIGAVLEIETNNNAGEVLKENTLKLKEVVNSLIQLGIAEENILNLGSRFTIKMKPRGRNISNDTQVGDEKYIALTNQLEIQVYDIIMAAKVIDVLTYSRFKLKYMDYIYKDDTLNYLVKTVIDSAMENAMKNAIQSLVGTGMKIGQMINLNVFIDENSDFQKRSDERYDVTLKFIKVIVRVSYTIEKRTLPEEITNGLNSKI